MQPFVSSLVWLLISMCGMASRVCVLVRERIGRREHSGRSLPEVLEEDLFQNCRPPSLLMLLAVFRSGGGNVTGGTEEEDGKRRWRKRKSRKKRGRLSVIMGL